MVYAGHIAASRCGSSDAFVHAPSICHAHKLPQNRDCPDCPAVLIGAEAISWPSQQAKQMFLSRRTNRVRISRWTALSVALDSTSLLSQIFTAPCQNRTRDSGKIDLVSGGTAVSPRSAGAPPCGKTQICRRHVRVAYRCTRIVVLSGDISPPDSIIRGTSPSTSGTRRFIW